MSELLSWTEVKMIGQSENKLKLSHKCSSTIPQPRKTYLPPNDNKFVKKFGKIFMLPSKLDIKNAPGISEQTAVGGSAGCPLVLRKCVLKRITLSPFLIHWLSSTVRNYFPSRVCNSTFYRTENQPQYINLWKKIEKFCCFLHYWGPGHLGLWRVFSPFRSVLSSLRIQVFLFPSLFFLISYTNLSMNSIKSGSSWKVWECYPSDLYLVVRGNELI